MDESQLGSEAKRARKTNFSSTEIDILTSEVCRQTNYLFGKLSSAVTSAGKKKIWIDIASKLSASSSTIRDPEEIRKKWTDLRSQVKKKEIQRRRELKKTGGGPCPPPLTDVEQRVASIIPDCQLDGIDGGVETPLFGTSAQIEKKCSQEIGGTSEAQATDMGSVETAEFEVNQIVPQSVISHDALTAAPSTITQKAPSIRPMKHVKRKSPEEASVSTSDDTKAFLDIEREKLQVLKGIWECQMEMVSLHRRHINILEKQSTLDNDEPDLSTFSKVVNSFF